MKKLCFIMVFLAFWGGFAFADTDEPEEIDFLLFLPNSSTRFVNEDRAMIQLNDVAKYLLNRDLVQGQIFVYGYAAVAENDIEPVILSRDRALFIINELKKRGIQNDLFSDPVAHGEVNLWGDNLNEEHRSPNRRVRILLDGNFLTPVIVKAAEAEVKTPVTINERVIVQENKPEKSKFKLPWAFLIPILLLLLLLILLMLLVKRRRRADSVAVQESSPAVPPPVMDKEPDITPIVAAEAKPPIAPVVIPVKTGVVTVNLEEEIRYRAYELYQERNGQNGDMDGDWYIALPEICGRYEAKGYTTYPEDGSWWARKSS